VLEVRDAVDGGREFLIQWPDDKPDSWVRLQRSPVPPSAVVDLQRCRLPLAAHVAACPRQGFSHLTCHILSPQAPS